MRRTMRAVFTAVGIAAVLLAAPSVRADDPLDAFPSDTVLVLRINNPEVTFSNAETFLRKVTARPGVEWSAGLKILLGVSMQNQDLEGIDMHADWWLGLINRDSGESSVVWAIPVTNRNILQDVLTDEVKVVYHRRWAIYSDDPAATEMVQAQLESGEDSLRTVIGDVAGAVLNKGDLSVFLNIVALSDMLNGESIRDGKLRVADGDDEMERILNQFALDLTCWVGALTVDAAGFHYEDLWQVRTDSPSAEDFKKSASATLESLADLPAGEDLYIGMSGALLKYICREVGDNTSDDDQPPQESDRGAQKIIAALLLDEFAVGMNFSNLFGLDIFDSGEKFHAVWLLEGEGVEKGYQDLIANLLKVDPDDSFLKTIVTVLPATEKHKDIAIDIVRKTYEPLDGADAERAADSLKSRRLKDELWLGPEGLTVRSLSMKNRILLTTGGGQATMTHALDSLQERDTSDVQHQGVRNFVRGKLPKQAQILVLVDASKVLEALIGDMFSDETDGDGLDAVSLTEPNRDTSVDVLGSDASDESRPLTELEGEAADEEHQLSTPTKGTKPTSVEHPQPASTETTNKPKSYLGFALNADSSGVRSQVYLPAEQAASMFMLLWEMMTSDELANI